ncbi:MAG: RelA/SpoT family protein [Patescibacteria group bacterium]|nr:RelA/SpoT family protein [Patescibacteria group bacterium]
MNSAQKPQLNKLLEIIKVKQNLSEDDKLLIKKAYEFSEKSHSGQKRLSGESYFTHPFQSAISLAKWHLDVPTIVAALLHDIVEDTPATLEEIKKQFGEEIAFLVNGVTKLGKLKYRKINADESEKIKNLSENLRKMILAISEDLRVVFIKLADRLHNMRTLSAIPVAKQKRIALETSEIYAPLAYRLGMQNMAGELDDLAFPFIHPQEYRWLTENIKEKYDRRVAYLEKVKPVILEELKKNSIIPVVVDSRAKRISSLYKKLFRYNMNLDQIYDLVALRIIVNTIEECYAVLGIIHYLWPPVPGRIKDYIALPKPNGYRSLHTSVFCIDNKITEFQIRTKTMHEEAEFGIAAHWAYNQAKATKEFLDKKVSCADKIELKWVQQLRNWQQEFTDSQEFIKSLKVDFFKDRVFAITPKGEVIDLPAGSIPVDFAYQIHTQIGEQCVGAKVNGKIVPLDYQIQSGDVIEILTQKNKKSSESWLKSVKTSFARRRIKAAIRKDSKILRPPQTELRVVVNDRVGLIKDISAAISRSHINITNINLIKTSGLPVIKIACDIGDKEKAEKLLVKIKNIKGVREVSYKLISL